MKKPMTTITSGRAFIDFDAVNAAVLKIPAVFRPPELDKCEAFDAIISSAKTSLGQKKKFGGCPGIHSVSVDESSVNIGDAHITSIKEGSTKSCRCMAKSQHLQQEEH